MEKRRKCSEGQHGKDNKVAKMMYGVFLSGKLGQIVKVIRGGN